MDIITEQTPDKIRDEVRSALKSGAAGVVRDAASAVVKNELPAALRESLSKATPSWSKDGLGLRGKEQEKVAVGARTAIDSRLPTYKEIETPALEDKKPEEEETPGSATPTELRPWDIINLRGEGEPDSNGKYSNYKAEVWPGTVAGLMPSNLFSGGKLATFTVGADLQKWKAKCLTDGRQITSVEIVVGASDPPAQTLVASALPAEAWFLFGLTFEGAVYRTLGPSNPSVTLNQAVVTDKPEAPPPGVPGVDRWYRVNFA